MSISRALAYYSAATLVFGFIVSIGLNYAGQGRQESGMADLGDLLMIVFLVLATALALSSVLAAIVARAARESRTPHRN
jgi:hypothetical protein